MRSAVESKEGLQSIVVTGHCRSERDNDLRVSHYLGVSWSQHLRQWQAHLQQQNGVSELIGTFTDEEDAARGYDQCAMQSGGASAVRNFMPSTYTGEAGDAIPQVLA